MVNAVKEYEEKLDLFLKKEWPEFYSELDTFKKTVSNKIKNNLEFCIAYPILMKYINEWTSTEKKIAYLLNNKWIYYLLENNNSKALLEAIQLLKKEQTIYIKYFSSSDNDFKFKNKLECLEKFEGIVENTVENGFNYYKELVETTPII